MADYTPYIISGAEGARDMMRLAVQRKLAEQNRAQDDYWKRQSMALSYSKMSQEQEQEKRNRLAEIQKRATENALKLTEGNPAKFGATRSALTEVYLQEDPEALDYVRQKQALQQLQLQQQQMMKERGAAMQSLEDVDVTFKPNDKTTIKTTGDKVVSLAMNPATAGQVQPLIEGMARATFYNPTEDQYGSQTAKPNPITGVNQAEELTTVAVDPKIIPYGSKLQIPELAKKMGLSEDHLFLAHDTGGAVRAQTASKGQMPVIDIYTGSPEQTNSMANRVGVGGYAYKIVDSGDSAKPTLIPNASEASAIERYGQNVPRGTQSTKSEQAPLNNQLQVQLDALQDAADRQRALEEQRKQEAANVQQGHLDLARQQYELQNRKYNEEAPKRDIELEQSKANLNKILSELGTGKGSGKQLTDESTLRLSKFDQGLKDIALLQQDYENLVKNGKAGFVKGRVASAFGSLYGGDTEIEAYKNRLNSIVPGLARGVFGEVGVLTDKDIERYTKILSDPTTNPEIARKNFEQIFEKMNRGYSDTIKTYEKAGYNVSGFDDEVKNLNDVLKQEKQAQEPKEQPSIPSDAQIYIDPKTNEEFVVIDGKLLKKKSEENKESTLKNIAGYAGDVVAGAASAPYELANLLTPKVKGKDIFPTYDDVRKEASQIFPESKKNTGTEAAKFIGGTLGLAPIGKAVSVAGKALPYGSKAIQAVGKALQISSPAEYVAVGGGAAGAAAAEEFTPDSALGKALLPLAGAVTPSGIKRAIPAVKESIVPQINEVMQSLGKRAKELGIDVSLSQLSDSKTRKLITSTVEKVPFSGASKFREKQQLQFNRAVSKTIGEDVDKFTPEVMERAYERIGKDFEQAVAGENISVGDDIVKRLDELDGEAKIGLLQDDYDLFSKQLERFRSEIQDGIITGKKISDFRSKLSKVLKSYRASPSAQYIGDLQNIIVDTATSNDPAKKALLSQARMQYKNLKTIEPLIENASDSGNISAARLLTAVRKSYSSFSRGGGGELGDLARIGSALLKEKIPDSGTAQRVFSSLGLLGGGGLLFTVPVTTVLSSVSGILASKALSKLNTSEKLVQQALNSTKKAIQSGDKKAFQMNYETLVKRMRDAGMSNLLEEEPAP